MESERLKDLLKKYNSQTASPEEIRTVEEWYDRVNGDDPDFDKNEHAVLKANALKNLEALISGDTSGVKSNSNLKVYFKNFMKVAAVIGLPLIIGYLLFTKSPDGVNAPVYVKAKQEIKPGGNNAILELSDGSEVLLNNLSDGQITHQHGVKVIKTKSGELVYSTTGQPENEIAKMNKVSTPRGGTYHLILADKTEVWLNSGSSITFPTVFSGSERKVKVTGEAYFEVSKNKTKPFIVATNESEVRVLGTHFNINAYDEEEQEVTTLLEGAVSVNRKGQTVLLNPGQQAISAKQSNRINVKYLDDTEAAIAWKNGYFQFDNSDLKALMRQISRWYDVDVQYNGVLPLKQYTGKIPRTVGTKQLIEMLSYSGIHCIINDNKIIVNPNK